LGFKRLTPFLEAQLGVGFNIPSSTRTDGGQFRSAWRTQASIAYVFLLNNAFEGLESSRPSGLFSTPSLQQWNLLSQSDISFEFIRGTVNKPSIFDSYRLRIWQTIPRTWRFAGALRDTLDAEMSGITLLASFNNGRWAGSVGVGRGMISTGNITAGFFYPTAEIAYIIGSFPTYAGANLRGITEQ
jgi:hypothetical protein